MPSQETSLHSWLTSLNSKNSSSTVTKHQVIHITVLVVMCFMMGAIIYLMIRVVPLHIEDTSHVYHKSNARIITVDIILTENVDINATLTTLDGFQMQKRYLVVLSDQTKSSENGLYVFNGTTIVLEQTVSDLKAGSLIYSKLGETNKNKLLLVGDTSFIEIA